jgi:hypothetical protein
MMRISSAMSVCAIVIVAVAVGHGRADAWVTTPELGLAYGVQASPNGDVLSAGESIGPDLLDFSVRLQSGIDGTEIWHYQLDGSATDVVGSYNDFASDVAFDGAGDVIAGGSTRNTGTGRDVQIVKLGGADGIPLWTQVLDAPLHGDDSYSDMTLYASGDVVVTYTLVDSFTSYRMSVARLAGATGTVLWTHDVPGNPRSRGGSVAVDGAGNVIAGGDTQTTVSDSDVVAVKLDGTTGAELWRTVLSGGNPAGNDYGGVVTLDASGDVFVSAQTENSGGDGFTVFKLSGATGAIQWRYDHVSISATSSGYAGGVYIDGTGDVYAIGAVDYNGLLVKLSGSTGAELWTRKYRKMLFGPPVPDATGGLVVSGSRGFALLVMKLSPVDGRKIWRRTLKGNSYNGAYASAAAVDPDGDVVASGAVVTPLPRKVNGFPSYTVLKVCGARGRIRDTDLLCP